MRSRREFGSRIGRSSACQSGRRRNCSLQAANAAAASLASFSRILIANMNINRLPDAATRLRAKSTETHRCSLKFRFILVFRLSNGRATDNLNKYNYFYHNQFCIIIVYTNSIRVMDTNKFLNLHILYHRGKLLYSIVSNNYNKLTFSVHKQAKWDKCRDEIAHQVTKQPNALVQY